MSRWGTRLRVGLIATLVMMTPACAARLELHSNEGGMEASAEKILVAIPTVPRSRLMPREPEYLAATLKALRRELDVPGCVDVRVLVINHRGDEHKSFHTASKEIAYGPHRDLFTFV